MQSYSERYEAALALAARAHRDQVRKVTDIPYIVHPVHVATMLLRHEFSEDVVIAGLLHDIVEESDVPLSQIEAGFGRAVAEMVSALTEWKRENGIQRPWETRKKESLHQLRRTGDEVAAVKAADTLHSVCTLTAALREEGPAVWQHFSRGADPSLWYYQSVAEIVREHLGEHALADELDRAVADLESIIAETEDKSA